MRRTRLAILAAALAMLTGLAGPVLAADPAESETAVPTTAGATVTVEWTGTIPPGAEQSGACAEGPLSDAHAATLSFPASGLDGVRIQATATITYDGPANDVIVTAVLPDGSSAAGDAGFVDTDESVGFAVTEAGTYTILACQFAGATPQAYTGTLELEALEAAGTAPVATCSAPSQGGKYEQSYIDESRAGGEPITTTLDDGTLLWGSHAGTTHFYGPDSAALNTTAFVENYTGQAYYYFSEDKGASWEFVPRDPVQSPNPLAGVPASGFSDPEFAVDAAGNVYISEINLANIAVSKSTDGGRTYNLQNVLSFTGSDRQWMAADAEDVLYMTANGFGGGTFPTDPVGELSHFIAKSTDGGATFGEVDTSHSAGVADIKVDPATGDVLEISAGTDGTLGLARYVGAREKTGIIGDELEITTIAEGVGYSGVGRLIDPTFDMDDEGNLYMVWTENGTGARAAGIWYSYSTDGNESWADPIRVDPDERTEIWPWLTVGKAGQVAIGYLGTEAELENNNAELAAPDDAWNVIIAQTQNGLGCGDSTASGFGHTQATSEAPHSGTICQGGTICQAQAIDRRLGDYFAVDTDGDGDTYASVSDTRQGGGVALPLIVRQVGGPNLFDVPEEEPPPTPLPTATPSATATPAPPGQGAEVTTISGEDAVAGSVAVSSATFDQAATTLLARDDDFPDALAAGGLAAALDAPVLLTGSGGLDQRVADELERLGAEKVVLLGGTAALSAQVQQDAEGAGLATERIGGPERFATAALVADEVVGITGSTDDALVALGGGRTPRGDFPDALASVNLAAAAEAPILLVGPDEVPSPTADALGRLLDDDAELFIAGGVEAVGPGAEQQLDDAGYTTTRVAGGERYATAVALAEAARALGAPTATLYLASGDVFNDALVAGPAAVHAGGLMLLVQPDDLDQSAATRDFLSANAEAIEAVRVVSSADEIDADVADQVRAALDG